MNIKVTITYINGDYDNFDVYTSNGTNDILYSSNINKSQLISGYLIINAPTDTTKIKLISKSNYCNGNITLIDIDQSNYIYVQKISNTNYKMYIRLITIPGNGPYNIVYSPLSQLILLITNNTGTYIDLFNLSYPQTSFYFTNNILNIEYNINNYIDITNILCSDLNLFVDNGNNVYKYEFDNNIQITNSEILSSTKKYINLISIIQ